MWGYNNNGRLGNGTTTDSSTPIDITSQFNFASGETIVSVSLGESHSSALTSSGRFYIWGNNNYGQLGNGTTTNSSTPIDITSQFNLTSEEIIVKVSLGTYDSSAITPSGRLFMWGDNSNGQLGNGTTTNSLTPSWISTTSYIKDFESSQVYGSNITPYTPIKEGYTFSGWFTDLEMTTSYTWRTMPANNFNLYGYWIPNS
jgi:uncharacterized repeat protein (TIGR02543 family)